MSLSAIENLREKIKSVQQRRKRVFFLRQCSLTLAGIVVLLLIFGWLEMSFQFSWQGRVFLFFLWILGLLSMIGRHSWRARRLESDQQRLAHYVEDRLPDLEQRLLTSIEFDNSAYPENEKLAAQAERTAGRSGVSAQLVNQLWEDAQTHIRHQSIERVATFRKVWPAMGTALLISVFWMTLLFTSVDFFHASSQILWPWQAGEAKTLPVELTVIPGDLRMQRGKDLTIVATVENSFPERVNLYLQTNRAHWESEPMRTEGEEQTYTYYLSSVQEDLSYYVDTGGKRSRQYRVSVFEMPRLEKLEVDYDYPRYTGMPSKTGEPEGDIIAPQGTRVTLHATFNKPVSKATLQFNDGTTLELSPPENSTSAVGLGELSRSGGFTVLKDASYTIRVTDQESLENVNPTEYFVRSIPDKAPQLSLLHPGKDRRVTSLEEVFLRATASDDYGLNRFVLHYSISGGDEQQVPLSGEPRQQLDLTLEGDALIYLEELEVKPGDFVSYYLSAADNNGLQGPSEVFSDIYFLEVISTKEEFRRVVARPNQGGMGGGEMGGRQQQSSALAENQKKIIVATWKLLKQQKNVNTNKFTEDVQVVASSQSEVLQRAQMSLRRLTERFSYSDESYDTAVSYMEQAVEQMALAREKLDAQQLKEALVPEQAALQAILKADALSKKTRIETAQNPGQGGGTGSREQQEREDLRELFEMEMGRLENRYEMPGQNNVSPQQAEEEEVLRRLQELAQRQELMNRRQNDLARRQNQISEEEMKRRLEELRREQQALQLQTEELSQSASRLTRQGIVDGRMNRPGSSRLQQLEQASRQMQDAARSLLREDTKTAAQKSRQALENLRNQEQAMRSRENKDAISNLVDALNRKAWQLRELEDQIQKNLQRALLENIQDLSHADQGESDEFDADVSDAGQPASTEMQDGAREDTLASIEENRPAQESNQPSTQEVLTGKEQLEHDLRETEKLLRTILARGNEKQPQIATRALDALRTLRREHLIDRVESSRFLLENGMLENSKEMEEKIAQSIEFLSTKLQQVGGRATLSRDEQIQQATADVGRLRRELENLRQQVENPSQINPLADQQLQQQSEMNRPSETELSPQVEAENQGRQGAVPSPQEIARQGRQGTASQQGQRGQQRRDQMGGRQLSQGEEPGARINQMRENLERAQYYARGLIEPWTRGERWAEDARSIHRELTRKEIEDFFTRSDIWKQLLEPILELESQLQAQAEISQLKNRLFSVEQEDIPATYENLVEEYYRALSQPHEGRPREQ